MVHIFLKILCQRNYTYYCSVAEAIKCISSDPKGVVAFSTLLYRYLPQAIHIDKPVL